MSRPALAVALALLAACGKTSAPVVEGGTIGADGVFHASAAPFEVVFPPGAAVRRLTGGPNGTEAVSSETGGWTAFAGWIPLPQEPCDDEVFDGALHGFQGGTWHLIGEARAIKVPGAVGARLQRFRSQDGALTGELRLAVAGRLLYMWSVTAHADDKRETGEQARFLGSFRITAPRGDAGAGPADGAWRRPGVPATVRFPTPACLEEKESLGVTVTRDPRRRLMVAFARPGATDEGDRRTYVSAILDTLHAELTESSPMNVEGATLASSWSFRTAESDGELRFVAVEPWIVYWMAIWPHDDEVKRTRGRVFLDSFEVSPGAAR